MYSENIRNMDGKMYAIRVDFFKAQLIKDIVTDDMGNSKILLWEILIVSFIKIKKVGESLKETTSFLFFEVISFY